MKNVTKNSYAIIKYIFVKSILRLGLNQTGTSQIISICKTAGDIVKYLKTSNKIFPEKIVNYFFVSLYSDWAIIENIFEFPNFGKHSPLRLTTNNYFCPS